MRSLKNLFEQIFFLFRVSEMSGSTATLGVTKGIASAGTTAADATPLTTTFNQVTSCPTDNSAGVLLPSAYTGIATLCYIKTLLEYDPNNFVPNIQVYAPTGMTVDGSAAVTQQNGYATVYVLNGTTYTSFVLTESS